MVLSTNKVLLKLLSDRLGRSATRLELAPRIKLIGGTLPTLTDSEKKSVNDIWKPIGLDNINFDYWRFYKAIEGKSVNPSFVPDNLYWSRIIRALNPASLTRTYINKSLYPIIFKGLRQPEVLINVINGVYYNGKMDRLSLNAAIDTLANYGGEIIIKPTTATSGGAGVAKIPGELSSTEIRRIIEGYGKDFICQGVVKQSNSTASFNPSSLNTFRVNTVNINGNITCECLMMRHGLNGNVVDNFAAGGVVCGMTKDGKFNGINFNTDLKRLSCRQDGTLYSDCTIPGIDNVINTAIESHRKFMPHIGHAAWDFAIDDDEMPVMIEVNLMLPGIVMEQLTSSGSIFGERTEEVIQYAINRNKTLMWTEFVGGW